MLHHYILSISFNRKNDYPNTSLSIIVLFLFNMVHNTYFRKIPLVK